MTKSLITILTVTVALFSADTWSEEGFILKAGIGEVLGNGIVVKASPRTGTERSILVEQTFQTGGTTGLHLHEQGDELFYVVSGQGTATLEGVEEPIGPGDVIFVPASAVHRIRNLDNDDPMTVVFFMGSPELVDLFRAIHERHELEPNRPITPDEFAELENQTGGGRSAN
jgi:quercetin dioxygenase-like cupin family protein